MLQDGTRLEGEVTIQRDRVLVRQQGGLLTVPAWRVARASAGGAALGGRPAAVRPAAAEGPRTPGRPAEEDAALAEAERALGRRIPLAVRGAGLAEALDYVRDAAGLKMVVAPEVRADLRPVDLSAGELPAGLALEMMLEPRGYAYSVRPGGIVFVAEKSATLSYSWRVYSVADLLVDSADAALRGGRRQRAGQGGRR